MKASQFSASLAFAVATFGLVVAIPDSAPAQTATVQLVAAKRVKVDNSPRVYLIRGFLNVFSMGMDDVAADIKSKGIYAEAFSGGSGGYIVDQLIADYKKGKRGPIILVGHSLGAPEVVHMSDQLAQAGITTDLVISLDPISSVTANGRVKQLLNFYVSDGPGQKVLKGPRFRGTLRNIDLKGRDDVGHVAIAQSRKFHKELERYILSAARVRSSRPARAAPKPDTASAAAPAETSKSSAAKPASADSADKPAATKASAASSAAPESTGSTAKPADDGAATAR